MGSFYAQELELTALFRKAVEQDNNPAFLNYVNMNLTSDAIDVKSIIELTVREVLIELIEKAEVNFIERTFQFSIDLASKDVAPGNLPVLVLGDLFEASTIVECEKYFDFVEKRVETFKLDIFFKACKNHLLRSCNDLLKRLSRSQNTVFCGRILMFLAHIFPLSERSGLNIISEFNVENTTIFSANDDAFSDMTSEQGDIDEKADSKSQPSIVPDKNLYQKFWSVQDYFRCPNTCYNKLQWRHFVSCTTDILTVFGSFKSDDASSSKWKQAKLPSPSGASVYFAKYLTSPKLLELELSDSHFRRYVLVQFLILFQYLNSPVKFKLESFVLSDEQQAWIKETTKTLYKLLDETPPNGATFARDVEKVLQREEHWNVWKNEGCPDFKQSTDRAEIEKSLKKRPLVDLKTYPSKKTNSHLSTKLWNATPNNWEACKSAKRNFVPSVESFFSINNGKLEGGVLNLRRNLEDSKYSWKALRLLCMKSPSFFSVNPNLAKSVPEYIETAVQRLAKEIPISQPDEVEAGGAEDTIEEGPDEYFPTPEEDCRDEDKVKKENILTKSLIESISSLLESHWQPLASKLGFQEDEIEYYEDAFPSAKAKTEQMLTVWMERDGSLEEFMPILEGLDLLSKVVHILQP